MPKRPAESPKNPKKQQAQTGSSGRPSTSASGDQPPAIQRGGFRRDEIVTAPTGREVTVTAMAANMRSVDLLSNFVSMNPMKKNQTIYCYRLDFRPDCENQRDRRRLFDQASEKVLQGAVFDGVSECRSMKQLKDTETTVDIHITSGAYQVVFKRTGTVEFGLEMFRMYNIHLKKFLKELKYYSPVPGLYVHPTELAREVDDEIKMLRGYRTSINQHADGRMLINFELGHKLMQKRSVYDVMRQLSQGPNIQERIRSELTGKIVIPNYDTRVYRIEDVDFNAKPSDTFDSQGEQVSFIEYFRKRWNLTVQDRNQAMLVVVPNNRRKNEAAGDDKTTLLIPEHCHLAGLTQQQVSNTSLKMTLIRATQMSPAEHVENIRKFLLNFSQNDKIKAELNRWGYSYGTELEAVKGHQFTPTRIGFGDAAKQPIDRWPQAKIDSADFNVNGLAVKPKITKVAVLMSEQEMKRNGLLIKSQLKNGFQRAGIPLDFDNPNQVRAIQMPNDSPASYVKCIKGIPRDAMLIAIMSHQNKERYDAIKKLTAVEMGMLSQVVTSKLLQDQRKAQGATLKIAIQVAAKGLGEPWWVNLNIPNAMICGYDTYHDTANRGRSYGAFLASTNDKFSQWFSRADAHDHFDEMSSQIARNVQDAVKRYKDVNGKLPQKIFIYRDGVGEGQIKQVYDVELKRINEVVKKIDSRILLTIILVNKRIGARFYLNTPRGAVNPPPGTVVDKVVTRRERFDFFLISQSTRQGTVTPTYYNVIGPDDSNLTAAQHQEMAYRLCMLYYNWSGSVRVPAPCQYAHKLALLCGENLHAVPNSLLDRTLHFL